MISLLQPFEDFFLDGNHRSNIHLVVAIIGAIICFIPIYGNNVVSHIETPDSVDAIEHGILFKCASVVSLTLAFLLFLDLLFDFIMSIVARTKQNRVNDKKKKDNHVDLLNYKEMLLFLAGVITIPMTSFFPSGTRNIVIFTQMCTRAQLLFIAGAMIASLNRVDRNYFPMWVTLGILVVFIIGQIVFSYYINSVDASYAAHLYVVVLVASWVLGVVGFLLCAHYIVDTILFALCGFKRWKLPFYDYFCGRGASVAEVDDKNGNKRPDAELQPYTNGHIYFRMAHCMMMMVFILIRAVLIAKYPTSLSTLNDITLFAMLIPPILLAACVLQFNLRLVKHEAVESLIELLDAKKSYVRYISHGTYCTHLLSNKRQPNSETNGYHSVVCFSLFVFCFSVL